MKTKFYMRNFLTLFLSVGAIETTKHLDAFFTYSQSMLSIVGIVLQLTITTITVLKLIKGMNKKNTPCEEMQTKQTNENINDSNTL